MLSYRVSCSLLQKFVWRAEAREARGAVVLMFLEMTLNPVVRARLILSVITLDWTGQLTSHRTKTKCALPCSESSLLCSAVQSQCECTL